jgi:catechol 2,3-dioxygenase-like lactoylglutathione lyase family enzyme
MFTMPSPNIRYIVRNVEEAVSFFTKHLGFTVAFQPAPGFAIVARGDVLLALNAVGGPGGASQPMPDGRVPEPGGWNRILLEVHDLEALVNTLRATGVTFRNTIVSGIGGKQILVEDPSGNPIELFEPKA